MLGRAAVVAGGLAGAFSLSQFPEFSQQYTQRLAGAVDELTALVEAFDADADKLNMGRDEALDDLSKGGDMGRARANSMQVVFIRHEKLTSDLSVLRAATPVERATQAWRMTDTDVASKVWSDFKPAVPVTFEGLGFAGAGFALGWLVVGLILGVLRLFFMGTRRET